MPPKQIQNLSRKNLVNEIAQRFENISANKTDQNASNSTLYNKRNSHNLNEWEDIKFENKLTNFKKKVEQPNKKMASIGLLRNNGTSHSENVFYKNDSEVLQEETVNSIQVYSHESLTNKMQTLQINNYDDSSLIKNGTGNGSSDEIFFLKNEINSLKTELNALKVELFETKSSYKEFYTALIAIQDKQNQDIKNMRKKIIFLMKKSMDLENGCDVTSDEEGEAEKTIHF